MKWIVPLRLIYIAGLFLICLPGFSFASSPADRARSYFEEGIELNKQRRYDEALEKFTQAATLSLDTHIYHQAVYRTRIALRRGPQGTQFYKDLAAKHPTNATVRYWLGRFHLESRALEEAAKEFEEAARLAPRDEHAFVSLGHVYLRIGKEKEALEAYTQANRLSPKIAVVHAGMANIHYRWNHFDKAQKEYEAALAIDPSLMEARYNLGLIYEKKGEISNAVKQWQAMVEADPNESRAREKLARIYFLGGEYLDAAREYATLSQVKQGSPDIFLALGESQVLLAAGLSDPNERRQLIAMAIQAFQRTIELDPKNAQARKYLDRLNSEKPAPAQKNERAPSEKTGKGKNVE